VIGPRSEGASEGRNCSPVRSSKDDNAAAAIPAEAIKKATTAVSTLSLSRDIISILAATTEEILKRLALGLALALLPLAGAAQGLLVGVVRDQDGAVVSGARIVGRDASGREAGSAIAGPDGTFALTASGVTSVDVGCDYCLALRGIAPASPLVVLIMRFGALALAVPNDRDLAALPYARAENAAALQPFTFTAGPGNLSFGLDRERGLISTAGIAFYRISDGGNALTSLPDRYLERLITLAPAQGYRYGDYADAGTFDIEPLADERIGLRLDGGPAESVAARYATAGLAAAVGESYGSGIRQARADVVGTSSFMGGTLHSIASLAGSGSETYSALGLQYATASRRYETYVDANAVRSTSNPTGPGSAEATGSAFFTDVRVRNRGPVQLEFGGRFRSSNGHYAAPYYLYQSSGLQQEAALYTDLSFSAAGNTLQAAAGLTHIFRNQYGYFGPDTTVAPIGSLAYAYAFGPHFTFTAGGSALPRVPTLAEAGRYAFYAHALLPVDRDELFQSGFSYTDRSRISTEIAVFRERIAGAGTSVDAGAGISLAWQIAPELALRAWSMQPSQSLAAPYVFYAPAALPRTSSVWLTYDRFVRFDAIYYGGRIDGDVNFPVARDTIFRVGRDSSSGSPLYSFGLRYVR